MKSNIANLVKVELLGRFGFNEARYSKDPAKKRRLYLMIGGMGFVGIVLMGYILAIALAFLSFGAGECVPAYMLMVTSLVIFFVNAFKAGSVLFQMQTYEMLIALPISVREITVSRFLSMYLEDLLLAVLTMLPGSILYAVFERAGVAFWLMTLVGIFVIPLFPLVAASLIGVVVTAVGARVRHRNLVSLVLSFVVLGGILAAAYLPSVLHPEMAEQLSFSDISSIGSMLVEKVNSTYFLAGIYHKAVINGDIAAFLAFLAISLGVFLFFLLLAEKNFVKICEAITAKNTSRNFRMGTMKQNSRLVALWKKEIKRYFASNAYVMNTAVGYFMMLLLSAAVAVMGVGKLEEAMQMPGVIGKALPFLLGWMAVMAPLTAASISMEGKNWWIPMSLPVTARELVLSKIMVNLALGIPVCLFSAVLCSLRFYKNPQTVLLLFLLPAAYSAFSSVWGIVLNEHFPMMKWDNELAPVKQSSAVMIAVFGSFLLAGIPGVILFLVPAPAQAFVPWGTAGLLLFAGALLYNRAVRFDFHKIEA